MLAVDSHHNFARPRLSHCCSRVVSISDGIMCIGNGLLVQRYAALVSFSSRDLGGDSLDSAKPARTKEKAQIHFKCTNKLEILIEAETNRRKLNRSTHVFIRIPKKRI